MTVTVRRVTLAVVAVSLVATLVAPTGARPPPTEVCGVCGEDVVTRETVAGTAPAVAETTVRIRIDEDGTGHWIARTNLTTRIDPDRWNESALRQLVVRRLADEYTAPRRVRTLSVETTGKGVVVRFSVPDMGSREAGVVLVDFFHWRGDWTRWFTVDADRVRISGPEGTSVTRAPPSATVADGTIVVVDGETLHRGTFLAFGDGGVGSELATELAVTSAVVGMTAPDLPGAAGLPVVVLAVVVSGLLVFGDRLRDVSLSTVARVAGGLAFLGHFVVAAYPVRTWSGAGGSLVETVVVGVLLGAYSVAAVVETAFVGVLAVGIWYLLTRFGGADRSLRTSLFAVGGALATVVLVAVGMAGIRAFAPVAVVVVAGPTLATLVPLAVPVAACLGMGVAHARDHPVRFVLAAATVLSPVVWALAAGPYSAPVTGYFPVVFVPWALTVGALGTVAFAVGVRVADADTGDENAVLGSGRDATAVPE